MAETIARNAPCPCGSGRKHKMCCLPQHDGKPRTGEDAIFVLMPTRGQISHETLLYLAWLIVAGLVFLILAVRDDAVTLAVKRVKEEAELEEYQAHLKEEADWASSARACCPSACDVLRDDLGLRMSEYARLRQP